MQHLPQSRSLPVSQSCSLAVYNLQSTICSDLWRFSMRDHDSAAESLLIFGPQMREVKRKSTICSALLLAGRETEQKTAEDSRRLVDGWTRETAAAAALRWHNAICILRQWQETNISTFFSPPFFPKLAAILQFAGSCFTINCFSLSFSCFSLCFSFSQATVNCESELTFRGN